MPNPPAVAELILRGLLALDMRETMSGDLLEEYRESRVPAVGEFGADLWYWRQVGGMWLRAYGWLVVFVVLLLVVSDLFNTFRAPSGASYLDGLPRLVDLVISPLVSVVGLLGLATAYGSWRTQRWQGGFVAALGVSVLFGMSRTANLSVRDAGAALAVSRSVVHRALRQWVSWEV